jgi:carbonic anhydrase
MKTIHDARSKFNDLGAGAALALVSVPLCLGIAAASGAPASAGLVAGVIGGALVGALGRAPLAVVGPAAALAGLVASQIRELGTFEAFLAALFAAGLLQTAFGLLRAGFVSGFLPSGVVRGLLGAVGAIVMLKQVPHLLGDDWDFIGDLAFRQADRQNTLTEIVSALGSVHPGAAAVGLLSLAALAAWPRLNAARRVPLPASFVVLVVSPAAAWLVGLLGPAWAIGPEHRLAIPAGAFSGLASPDWSGFWTAKTWVSAAVLAAAASLESFVGLEAASRLDPLGRRVPINRELLAAGAGNAASALLGGLPVTTLIVRSGVAADAGSTSKATTVAHGVLLAAGAALFPVLLNAIPLSAVAAVLAVAGWHLVQRAGAGEVLRQGRASAVIFAASAAGAFLVAPLAGILMGIGAALLFVLRSMTRNPFRLLVETHVSGKVLRVQLADQVSFLNRAALAEALDSVEEGGQVVLDARGTDFIDPDVLALIKDFESRAAPARGVHVSLQGFKPEYELVDRIRFVDVSTRELQSALTPAKALSILRDGNARFLRGEKVNRDLVRQVGETAAGQFPIAAIVSCMDARAPAEMVFDLGLGDIFSVRVAGNIAREKVLGSVEYAAAAAGVKLVVVMGHTRCGAVKATVQACVEGVPPSLKDFPHIVKLVEKIRPAVEPEGPRPDWHDEAVLDRVTRRNVVNTIAHILEHSPGLEGLVREGRLAIVGAVYDLKTGAVEFFPAPGATLP